MELLKRGALRRGTQKLIGELQKLDQQLAASVEETEGAVELGCMSGHKRPQQKVNFVSPFLDGGSVNERAPFAGDRVRVAHCTATPSKIL